MKVHSIIKKMINKIHMYKNEIKIDKTQSSLPVFLHHVGNVLRERAFVEVKGLNILVKY